MRRRRYNKDQLFTPPSPRRSISSLHFRTSTPTSSRVEHLPNFSTQCDDINSTTTENIYVGNSSRECCCNSKSELVDIFSKRMSPIFVPNFSSNYASIFSVCHEKSKERTEDTMDNSCCDCRANTDRWCECRKIDFFRKCLSSFCESVKGLGNVTKNVSKESKDDGYSSLENMSFSQCCYVTLDKDGEKGEKNCVKKVRGCEKTGSLKNDSGRDDTLFFRKAYKSLENTCVSVSLKNMSGVDETVSLRKSGTSRSELDTNHCTSDTSSLTSPVKPKLVKKVKFKDGYFSDVESEYSCEEEKITSSRKKRGKKKIEKSPAQPPCVKGVGQ
jgi:hypothetical protein